jgi:hypothetical protein
VDRGDVLDRAIGHPAMAYLAVVELMMRGQHNGTAPRARWA